MEKIQNIIEKSLRISPFQKRVFFGTMIAMFFIVTLQLLHIKAPKIINPFPKKTDIFFERIIPKLEEKQSDYKLHTTAQIFPKAEAAREFEEASAYVLVDFDSGNIIESKNLSLKLPIASLTKIMSAVVTLDLVNPEEEFEVRQNAINVVPTIMGASVGERLTVTELLQAALMTSANDAAGILRDGVDKKYNNPVFIRAMNEKAQILGMRNTSFANPQGFDNAENYSSVEDLAVLSYHALHTYPLIADIARKDYQILPPNTMHKEFKLPNWNGLIDVYPNTIGLKIGNTEAAGKTTVVVSERAGKKLMVVLLGAPDIIKRDLWAAKLLDEGYAETSGLTPINVTEENLREKYNSWYSN